MIILYILVFSEFLGLRFREGANILSPENRGAIPNLVYIPARVEVPSPYQGRRDHTA